MGADGKRQQQGPLHHRVSVDGHCGQKSKFKGMTVKVEQTGRCQVHVPLASNPKDEEVYLITLPELTIRGLLSGSIFLDLTGTTKIMSSSGYVCSIEFLPKPWFVGDYHCIKGSIYHETKREHAEYTLSGRWVEQTMYTHVATEKRGLLFDHNLLTRPAKHYRTPTKDTPMDTRFIWSQVTEALKKGDFSRASAQKNEIEEKQRELRKVREQSGQTWSPKYFEFLGDSELDKHPRHQSHSSLKDKLQAKGATKNASTSSLIDVGAWRFKE
jgi:hypothetical protein